VNGQSHPDVAWHGERLDEPAWHDPGARFVAFTIAGRAPDESMLHIVFNMNDDARDAALPVLDNRSWRRIVDTAAEPPQDIVPDVEIARLERGACRVEARSVVVLESR
jgi:glycogen operon protein